MIKEMNVNGFDASEIKYYLKKSDEVYINQLLANKESRNLTKTNRTFKSVVLVISLLLLVSVFFGYASIGLIGLFILWSLVKFGSYRR
ncbi:hypothetical protein SAMN05444148_1776 [Winogradskyella jejuensis]|uniref:Uncharacterized protein n=2 Tax=Winogradskyella jejuensis TaxID=1089305 RepID=A0A1M5S5K4_9FLAO|nr:hypothetical protein SAMN05444148_1776 [Winogradskyella jejuensis]